MKFRPIALLACLTAVMGLAACSEDPTESGTGEPEAIVTTLSEAHRSVGASFSITAFAVDKNLKRIAGELTATSTGAAVSVDSVRYVPQLAETRIFLKANTASSAGTNVTISGHGLSKDVKVVIS